MSSPAQQRTPDENVKPLRSAGVKRKYLTAAQLAELRTGPRINILVGPQYDQYIGVESAYAKVLSHYSELAKRKLSTYGVTRLWVPNASKFMISWVYRYMLAGEKDPADIKFEQFDLRALITLWCHANALEYKILADKTFKRLHYVISTVGVFDVHIVQDVLAAIPGLRGAIVDTVVYDLTNWVGVCPYGYIHQIYHLQGMAELIDAAMKKELMRLVERSKWYYSQPHIKRQIERVDGQCHNQQKAPNGLLKSASDVPGAIDVHKFQLTHGKHWKKSDTPTINGGPLSVRSESAKVPTATVHLRSDAADRSTRQAKTCYNCGSTKHLARRCKVQDLSAADRPSEPPIATKSSVPSKKSKNKNTGVIKLTQLIEKNLAHLRSTKAEDRPKVCFNCGSLEHLARSCDSAITHFAPYQAPDSEKPLRCHKCGAIGHIAGDCGLDPTMAVPEVGDTSTASSVPKPSSRRAVACYNCSGIGHLARHCHLGPQRDPERVASAHVSRTLTVNVNPQNSPIRGGNKSSRRGKPGRRSAAPHFVEIAGNGEGITTCAYEVRPGQITRTGLVV